jgi:hypothetical protein
VDPVGENILEVDRMMEIGNFKENNSRGFSVGREDLIENRFDKKRRDGLAGPYDDHQADRQKQADAIGPYETEQALNLTHSVCRPQGGNTPNPLKNKNVRYARGRSSRK